MPYMIIITHVFTSNRTSLELKLFTSNRTSLELKLFVSRVRVIHQILLIEPVWN